MESETLFEVRDGRVHLTEAGRAAHWKVLKSALDAKGISASRATVFRAKTNGGVFIVVFHERGRGLQRRLCYGYVRLSKAERKQEPATLARRFGITVQTAQRAQKRGWFELQSSQNLTEVARQRARGQGEYLPEELQVV